MALDRGAPDRYSETHLDRCRDEGGGRRALAYTVEGRQGVGGRERDEVEDSRDGVGGWGYFKTKARTIRLICRLIRGRMERCRKKMLVFVFGRLFNCRANLPVSLDLYQT